MILEGMSKRHIIDDEVVVSAPSSFALENTRFFQLGYDPLNASFRDADIDRDVTEPGVWIPSNAQQYVRVIAEESPLLLHARRYRETAITRKPFRE